MQRVVSINLNGNAYQVEENGYNALFAYLDAADATLTDSPDRAAKLAELERVLAEKCEACLNPRKTVITATEIDRLLAELGAAPPPPQPPPPASEPAGASRSSRGARSGAGAPPPHSDHKRLYQIREGAMISGIAVGLSEYLHVDVTIIRILFVVFALVTNGWGVLVYGLLMFLLPRVDTRADAASGAGGLHPPYHWPWDNGWPWDRYGWPWDRPTPQQQQAREQDLGASKQAAAPPPPPPPSPPPAGSREARRAWRDARRAERRAARMAYGPHPHPAGTITMIIFLMLGFFWLSLWTRGNFFFGWPFFWGFPHWIGIIFFFLVLRLIFMPFRASRWYGYGPYGPYAHPHYAWVSMWNGLAWLVVMMFGVWFAYHYIPEVHDFIRSFSTSQLGYRL